MADQIKQELMQLVGQNPAFLQQARAQLGELARDPDIQTEELPQIVAELESVLRDPGAYPEMLARFEREGFVDPGDLPQEFDPQVVVALLVTFYLLQEQLQAEPRGFARGGLATAAERLRRAGRGGDTILAHINPTEARMLKAAGGSGTLNPHTGLPEFGFFKKLLKVVAPIALNFIAPGLGTAIGTAIGLTGTAAAVAGSALIGGTVSKLSGGNFAQGALGGAIGGGLGGAVGSTANEALGLGLGQTGSNVLGSALTGAAQSAANGGNVLAGALGGGLGAYGGSLGGLTGSALQGAGGAVAGGGDLLKGAFSGLAGLGATELGGNLGQSLGFGSEGAGALGGALGGAARAGVQGGDIQTAAAQGALAGSGLGQRATSSLASLIKPVAAPSLLDLSDKYGSANYNPSSTAENFGYSGDSTAAGYDPYYGTPEGAESDVMAGFKVKSGAAGAAPYPSMPGTFKLAPNSQVPLFRTNAPEGSMEKVYSGLPVYEMSGSNNYVNRFINAAESGYMNPDWGTYRPGVQMMASQEPMTAWGGNEAGTSAYVPKRTYPGTAQTVMLSDTSAYTPAQAANLLSHELTHINQPLEMLSTTGSNMFRSGMAQDITNTLPYLQQKYGYSGGYDNSKAEATNPIMAERMADLQGWQFNQGVDFAKDPVFQQQVLAKDPLRAALWNANTIERTTRLDPRDLTPGVITSSDFPKGQVPLSYQAQDAYRRFMNPGRTVGYARGGLALMKERVYG